MVVKREENSPAIEAKAIKKTAKQKRQKIVATKPALKQSQIETVAKTNENTPWPNVTGLSTTVSKKSATANNHTPGSITAINKTDTSIPGILTSPRTTKNYNRNTLF